MLRKQTVNLFITLTAGTERIDINLLFSYRGSFYFFIEINDHDLFVVFYCLVVVLVFLFHNRRPRLFNRSHFLWTYNCIVFAIVFMLVFMFLFV